jgi:hypothetical protein
MPGITPAERRRIMAREKTVKGKMGMLQRLLARLLSNREELKHLEPSLALFEGLFARIQEAADRQSFHTANKQEASQQVQSFLDEAERLATVLQLAVKQHYGIRSEKLADFGLQPFRGRPRKAASPPAPQPEASAAAAATPATAADRS